MSTDRLTVDRPPGGPTEPSGEVTGAVLTPVSLGGQLDDLTRLVNRLREVARLDLARCLDQARGALAAGALVWGASSPLPRRAVADVLLHGGRVAATGTTSAAMRLRPSGTDFALDGVTEPVAGARRADLLVVAARAEPGGCDRAVLVDRRAAAGERMRYLARTRTVGLRGIELNRVEFRDLPVAAESVVGLGEVTVARLLPALVVPSVAVATLDSALRVGLRFAAERTLAGRAVADLAYPRRMLGDVFVDMLICDCVCTVAVRAVQASPAHAAAQLAAVSYLVPRLLTDAARRLSVVLGATFYLRHGPFGMFQKHLRDLNQAVLGDTGGFERAMAALPTHRDGVDPATGSAPSALYDVAAPVPAWRPDRVIPADGGGLPVASLTAAHGRLAAGRLADLAGTWLAQARELAGLTAAGGARAAGPEVLDRADRYTRAVAAATCLNVWQARGGLGFLGDTAWIVRALSRLRPGHGPDGAGADAVDRELAARYAGGRTFDLADQPLRGGR